MRFLSLILALMFGLTTVSTSADAQMFWSKTTKTSKTKSKKKSSGAPEQLPQQPASDLDKELAAAGAVEEEEEEVESYEPAASAREREEEDRENPIGISGGIGFGAGYFSFNAAVYYPLSRFFGFEFSGFYRQQSGKNYSETTYGPEIDFMLRVPNSTMFTPFAGAGPGYEWWERHLNSQPLEESSALTLNGIVGLDLGISKHFSLTLANKWVMYVDDPPLAFEVPTGPREPRHSSRVMIGFKIGF